MSDISISAFDPLFWLHHCNIDRFFYNWLSNETNGFTKLLDSTQILPETLNLTLAPFFQEKIMNLILLNLVG
jgi:tyrosinase